MRMSMHSMPVGKGRQLWIVSMPWCAALHARLSFHMHAFAHCHFPYMPHAFVFAPCTFSCPMQVYQYDVEREGEEGGQGEGSEGAEAYEEVLTLKMQLHDLDRCEWGRAFRSCMGVG